MLISILITLFIASILMYAVGLLSFDPRTTRIAQGVILLFVLLWLLNGFGLLGTRFPIWRN